MKITQVDVPLTQAGEGPVWDVADQALYYIDIIGKKVFRYDPVTGEQRDWDLPDMVGSMALRGNGAKPDGALVALFDGIHTLDFASGAVTPLALFDPPNTLIQCADGKVDRRGRFVFGTTHRGASDPIGGLFSLAPDGTVTQLDEGLILGNGPCWSPDDKVLYHSDSMRHQIYAYDYDIETGTVANRREFFNSSDYGPIPDGATIDADGNMWVAICEGGVVLCLTPEGGVERVIDFPTRIPASCMFGGPELDRLYVPTLSPAFLGRTPAPLDGALFVIDGLGARGIPEPRFGG